MANPEIDNYVTEYHVPDHVGEKVVLNSGQHTANGATKDDLEDLKQQVNDSFCEVANMFLELQSGLAQLNERIALFNSRSSHKI